MKINTEKILIIEDDRDIRELTALFLTESGYEVATASDGDLGLQKSLVFFPDLIICDIAMGGKNGFEVLEVLQQTAALKNTPFIFLTAKTTLQDIREGMNKGADDYITKPFQLDELLLTVQTRLSKAKKTVSTNFKDMQGFLSTLDNPAIIVNHDKVAFVNEKLTECTRTNIPTWMNLHVSDVFTAESLKILEESKTSVAFENPPVVEFTDIISPGFKIYLSGILKHEHSATYTFNFIKEAAGNSDLDAFSALSVKLTPREKEVIKWLKEGKKTAEIAEKLNVSKKAIDKHRANLLEKFNVRNTPELISVTFHLK